MELKNLKELYVEQLREICDGQGQVTVCLTKFTDLVTSNDLRRQLEVILRETEEQARRLRVCFGRLAASSLGVSCHSIQGLIRDMDDLVRDSEGDVRDAALIAEFQKMEHYQIAGYGTACTYAKIIGFKDDLKALKKSLGEIKQADTSFTRLAADINARATVEEAV